VSFLFSVSIEAIGPTNKSTTPIIPITYIVELIILCISSSFVDERISKKYPNTTLNANNITPDNRTIRLMNG